jgi:hypothetical protein
MHMSTQPTKSSNRTTALILASVALVFFLGIIFNRVMFG